MLAFWALCVLPVCSSLLAQSKLPAKDHQRLLSYINTYGSTKLLQDPIVRPQLVRLMGAQLQHLEINLNVAGSVGVDSDVLTVSGNAPHQGLEENGFLGVNLYNGDAYACLLTKGKIEVYSKEAKYDYLPYPVRMWIGSTWAMVHFNGNPPPNVVLHPKP